MKTRNLLIALVAILSIGFTSCNSGAVSTEIKTESDTIAYALGSSIGTNLLKQFPDVSADIVAEAIVDAFAGNDNKLFENPQDAETAIRAYLKGASERAAKENVVKGEAFLAENAKKEGVTVTESGLQYEVMVQVEGEKPTAESTVKVHYHGTTIDGEVFDSSVDRGEPAQFPLNGVIKGWTEGVQLMTVGSKYKFVVPADLAYGERGAGGSIGPNSTLIFEVELLEIIK
ncbi:MAG: FKBP-type peptidyl-prolyl cis-trans isomerase [Prolixibacteraceae bacterium]|jgi:FKBP-type peptidyl-prolyl cis-trans isomerase FklB|nr:FKBP-type peptidyl-prolyl cis-trans isomerase [Prolixibacteraceae bacterium]